MIEADIRYPSDAMPALQGTRALAREGAKLARMVTGACARVRDRSRSVGRTVRAISKTLARRTGEAKRQVIELNARAGAQISRSAGEARARAAQARRAARGRGARAKLRAAARLEELAARCEKVAEQIARRSRGLKITDRPVSLADPDARPIRKGKLGTPTEFGYVAQIAEITPNTRRAARGFILPAATAPGNPAANTLLPATISELDRLGIRPRELIGRSGIASVLGRQPPGQVALVEVVVAATGVPRASSASSLDGRCARGGATPLGLAAWADGVELARAAGLAGAAVGAGVVLRAPVAIEPREAPVAVPDEGGRMGAATRTGAASGSRMGAAQLLEEERRREEHRRGDLATTPGACAWCPERG